jgi:hypothetical protein
MAMSGAGARGRRLSRVLTLAGFCSLVLAAPPRALADGPSRPATAKEEEFNVRVAGTFAKALPPGPEGWAERRDSIQRLERVATDAEKYPFRVSYEASWTDTARSREAEQKQAEALGKVVASPDQELQELIRQNEKLAKELGAAINKGDQATVERVNRELGELQVKMQKRLAVQDAGMKEAQRATSPRDVAIAVSLAANTFSETFYRAGAIEPPVGGGPVYRTQGETDSDGSWREGSTYVFLGKGWQLKKDGNAWMEAPQRAGVPSLAVQTIVVRADGDPARARSLLEKIDWASLRKLLAN